MRRWEAAGQRAVGQGGREGGRGRGRGLVAGRYELERGWEQWRPENCVRTSMCFAYYQVGWHKPVLLYSRANHTSNRTNHPNQSASLTIKINKRFDTLKWSALLHALVCSEHYQVCVCECVCVCVRLCAHTSA